MTESEYMLQVSNKQNAIASYEQSINEMEGQISELRSLKQKLQSMYDQLGSSSASAIGKLAGGALFGVLNSIVSGKFFESFREVVAGNPYVEARTGIQNAEDEVQSKIDQIKSQIETAQENILSCKSELSSIETEYQTTQSVDEYSEGGLDCIR